MTIPEYPSHAGGADSVSPARRHHHHHHHHHAGYHPSARNGARSHSRSWSRPRGSASVGGGPAYPRGHGGSPPPHYRSGYPKYPRGESPARSASPAHARRRGASPFIHTAAPSSHYPHAASSSRRHAGYSRSRSRSYSRSPRRYRPSRSSPGSSARRRYDAPARFPNPSPSSVLGIFGLSNRTRESDLRDLIEQYVPVKEVTIVYDLKTGASRRFGFATFETVDDAARVREKLNGVELHERCMRVDFSLTTRAHSPTPGEYRGRKPSYRDRYESGASAYSRRYPGSSRGRGGSRSRDRYGGRRGARYD